LVRRPATSEGGSTAAIFLCGRVLRGDCFAVPRNDVRCGHNYVWGYLFVLLLLAVAISTTRNTTPAPSHTVELVFFFSVGGWVVAGALGFCPCVTMAEQARRRMMRVLFIVQCTKQVRSLREGAYLSGKTSRLPSIQPNKPACLVRVFVINRCLAIEDG
jgi:hypothetical protein